MTDLPPRVPPRTDGTRIPEARPSQTSMWLVFLAVGAVILVVVAYTVSSWTSVDEDPTTPETTAPAATETAPAEIAPSEPAPADTGTGTVDPLPEGTGTVDPVPEGTGDTTQPAP